jgi:AmiR/NasT family two-component response regulator
MRLAELTVGALNLYSPEAREWSDEDIGVAAVLADMATSYVVNASKLRQQEQLSEQLQEALNSRIIIEQAKGIVSQRRAISIDQAYQLIRSHARNNDASLRKVAEAIVAVGLKV